MQLSQLTMEESLASEEDPPFAVPLTRDHSGFIFGEELGESSGESSLATQTLYPFARELFTRTNRTTVEQPT